MANVFNATSNLWQLATNDILTFRTHTNHNSGLMPICVRKVVLRPNATGDGVQFTMLNPSTAPTLTLAEDTFTVTNTNKIADDAGAALTQAKCTVGNWLYLYGSASGNNEGWWYITGNDGGNAYVTVQNTSHVLTNEDNTRYSIKIYVPEVAMVLVSETGDAGAKAIKSEVLDWGEKGRWFSSLAMYALSSSAGVDLYIR